jgi:50S ribosomal protein L16 3-hydroxylase
MKIDSPTPLLGGISPRAFMARHWQKKPLLVRQALPAIEPPLSRNALFALAERDDVESRLVVREENAWTLRHGPIPRRAIPKLAQPGWTLLVQGLNLLDRAAHTLLERFRFVPDARLDDVMLSYATDGGGVGPHLDSYDVFLLQVHGAREWRIGRVAKPRLSRSAPLKILSNFRAEQSWVLEPGDMLYLPPRWAHEGTARGECMTASIGFRAPSSATLADELLQRWLEHEPSCGAVGAAQALHYRDPRQGATDAPAQIPPRLRHFAAAALRRELADPRRLARALGEWLSEPKANVVFAAAPAPKRDGGLVLDARTRMLYDDDHLFVNGEAFRIGGRDAALLRRLADQHRLTAAQRGRLSAAARAQLDEWQRCGWLNGEND